MTYSETELTQIELSTKSLRYAKNYASKFIFSMEYEKEILTQIEKFASIYLKISDIAVILDIPADVLRSDIADRGTAVSKAYRRGKAASKVKLHSQEMMLAQVGSPLAIENAHRNLLDMEDDE